MTRRPRLHIVASVPLTLATLLHRQPRALAEHFDVHLITSPGDLVPRVREQEGLPVTLFTMNRQITPREDALTVARLTAFFRRERPDIVQTYTPKAGLLGMIAARAARVPHRVHGIVGMPLMERTGTIARVLTATEKLTYACATDLTSNSTGLRSWVHAHLTQRPITVIGNGSINGVDTEAWQNTMSADERAAKRAEVDLAPDDFVFLFIGRVVRDKGVGELVRAFEAVYAKHPRARLLMVGDFEPELDPVDPDTERALNEHPGIRRTGFVHDVRPWASISDAFVLPSYREGLPNSLIEAGSMGLPSIATDINGCNEVIQPGKNGVLVPVRAVDPLRDAMLRMLEDPEHYEALKASSRPNVVARFDQAWFHQELIDYYRGVLG